MKITVYSTTTCPYCKILKNYLEQKAISFEEKLIDTDDKVRIEMEKVSGGFLGVPFIVVEKDDQTRETIFGFDKGRLNSVLGIQ
ncbi:MAG: glutaredoxin family protein [bacterium]|nr:glutaredoxin family protein [bacterium]